MQLDQEREIAKKEYRAETKGWVSLKRTNLSSEKPKTKTETQVQGAVNVSH